MYQSRTVPLSSAPSHKQPLTCMLMTLSDTRLVHQQVPYYRLVAVRAAAMFINRVRT